jgi:hypothetical protein
MSDGRKVVPVPATGASIVQPIRLKWKLLPDEPSCHGDLISILVPSQRAMLCATNSPSPEPLPR